MEPRPRTVPPIFWFWMWALGLRGFGLGELRDLDLRFSGFRPRMGSWRALWATKATGYRLRAKASNQDFGFGLRVWGLGLDVGFSASGFWVGSRFMIGCRMLIFGIGLRITNAGWDGKAKDVHGLSFRGSMHPQNLNPGVAASRLV